jgi:hypothetical protein
LRLIRKLPALTKAATLDIFLANMVYMCFLIHATLSKQAFGMFACTQLGKSEDDLFLARDHEQACFDSVHMTQIGLVAVPMLVLFVVGIPVMGVVAVSRKGIDHHSPGVRGKYAMLFDGYRPEVRYWEGSLRTCRLTLITLNRNPKSANKTLNPKP